MSVYNSIYDLIVTYLFGGSVDVGSYQELVSILISSFGCIFLISLPFLVVWRLIKLIVG